LPTSDHHLCAAIDLYGTARVKINTFDVCVDDEDGGRRPDADVMKEWGEMYMNHMKRLEENNAEIKVGVRALPPTALKMVQVAQQWQKSDEATERWRGAHFYQRALAAAGMAGTDLEFKYELWFELARCMHYRWYLRTEERPVWLTSTERDDLINAATSAMKGFTEDLFLPGELQRAIDLDPLRYQALYPGELLQEMAPSADYLPCPLQSGVWWNGLVDAPTGSLSLAMLYFWRGCANSLKGDVKQSIQDHDQAFAYLLPYYRHITLDSTPSLSCPTIRHWHTCYSPSLRPQHQEYPHRKKPRTRKRAARRRKETC